MAEIQPDTRMKTEEDNGLNPQEPKQALEDPLLPVSPPPSQPVTSFVEPVMEGAIPARAMYPFGWSRRDVRRTIGLILAGLTAGYFLYLVQSIVPPFLIAFFLAALLDPTLRSMEKRGRSRGWSILSIYLLGFLILLLLALLLGRPLTMQIESLTKNFNDYYLTVEKNAEGFYQRLLPFLQKFGIRQESLREIMATQNSQESWIQRTAGGIVNGLSGLLQEAASKLFWLIIIPIAGFFFMLDFPLMRARLISFFPEHHHKRIDEMSLGVVNVFSQYIRGLARICALYGLTMCLFYWLVGLQYGLLLGLLAGVLYAMPYVGQLITAVVVGAVAYSMDQHHAFVMVPVPANSALYAIALVLTTVMVNNIFDQIVYPKIVGESVGLHPVVSIFALAAGATLFGIWGMLLAVPVAASIKIVLDFFFPKLTQPIPDHLLHPQPNETPPNPESLVVLSPRSP